MSVQLGNAYGKIIIGTDEAEKSISGLAAKMRGVQQQFSQVGANMRRTGGMMSLAVTTPIIGLGVAMTNMASDLRESANKTSVVFGQQADAIQKWSENSAAAFGLSQDQALEAVGTFGNLFDSMNVNEDATATMSKGLVQLAADLASFNNIDPTVALEKLRAGMVGEVEPLRALGVNVSVAATEAKALEMGLISAGETMTDQQKIAARYALIMDQTANAQGDFARTSGDLANMQRIVRAEIRNLSASFGQFLLPFALKVAQAMRAVIDRLKSLTPQMQQMIVIFGAVAAAIGPLLIGLGFVASALSSLIPVVGAVAGVIVFLLSPVGLLVAGLGALFAFDVGGLRTKFVGFARSAAASFQRFANVIRWGIEDGWDFQDWLAVMPAAIQPVATALNNLMTGQGSLGELGQAAWDAVQSAAENIRSAVAGIDWAGLLDSAGDMASRIQTTVSGWFSGVDLSGALDGITTAWDTALESIRTFDPTSVLTGAMDKIASGLTALDWSAVGNVIGSAVTAAIGGFALGAQQLGRLAGSVASAISNIDWTTVSISFDKLVTAVGTALAGLWEGFTVGLDPLKTAVTSAITAIDWTTMGENLLGAFDAVKDAVVTAITSINWSGMAESLGTAFNTMRDNVLASLTTTVTGIDWTTAISGMITSLSTAISGVDWSSVGATAATALKAAIGMAFIGTIAAVKSIQWVMDSENFAGLATAVKDAFAGIDWSVVKDALGELATTATAAWNEFTTALFAGLPEFSWSSFIPESLSWRSFIPTDLSWRSFIPFDLKWSSFVPSINWKDLITGVSLRDFVSGFGGGGNGDVGTNEDAESSGRWNNINPFRNNERVMQPAPVQTSISGRALPQAPSNSISININNPVVGNGIDMERLALQIERRLRRQAIFA